MPDSVADIVKRFALVPHPEGGFFREVHRSPLVIDHPALDATAERRRSSGTFIYFLLASSDFSAFHRVRASDEIWHVYAGGPLELHTIDAEQRYAKHVLTTDLARGEPALVVPGRLVASGASRPGQRLGLLRLHRRAGVRLRRFRDAARRGARRRVPCPRANHSRAHETLTC